MIEVIRKNVFETNSSSMHSITVDGSINSNKLMIMMLQETLSDKKVDEYKPYPISCDSYDWGEDSFSSWQGKLSYALTSLIQNESLGKEDNNTYSINKEALENHKTYCQIKDIVKRFTGFDLEIEDNTDTGSIDHQSTSTFNDFIDSCLDRMSYENALAEYLFNPRVTVVIGNDNH
jgi:hypothetical protein